MEAEAEAEEEEEEDEDEEEFGGANTPRDGSARATSASHTSTWLPYCTDQKVRERAVRVAWSWMPMWSQMSCRTSTGSASSRGAQAALLPSSRIAFRRNERNEASCIVFKSG